MSVDASVCDAAPGQFSDLRGDFTVTLRRLGDGLALDSLEFARRIPVARAVERAATAAVFMAPRSGADRYPDWAAFEHACRLPSTSAYSRVWRIAEDATRVCLLGQTVQERGAHFPLAAALWRGWSRSPGRSWRGLYWQGEFEGHLWLCTAHEFPRHIILAEVESSEALLVALASQVDPGLVTLELGGVARAFQSEFATVFPGKVMPVEPFSHLQVPPPLREQLLGVEDATLYLPAVGAARALLEGPPRPLTPCESLPAAAAAGG
jgi:hypothetical protein